MASITTKYLIPESPETAAAYQELTPEQIVSSTITDEYASGIVEVNVQSNGNVRMDLKRSHLTTDVWDTTAYTDEGNNKWFRRFVDVRGQKYQLVVTSLESEDNCNAKGWMVIYDGLSYASVPFFRDVTCIDEDNVLDHYVAKALLDSYDKVNQHTKKNREDPWLSTDEHYLNIQKAHAFLAAHYVSIRGIDPVPMSNEKLMETTTQWLYQYCLEMFDVMGYYPYELPGLPDVPNKHRTAFDGRMKMVKMQTTDSNSYTQTSSRSEL